MPGPHSPTRFCVIRTTPTETFKTEFSVTSPMRRAMFAFDSARYLNERAVRAFGRQRFVRWRSWSEPGKPANHPMAVPPRGRTAAPPRELAVGPGARLLEDPWPADPDDPGAGPLGDQRHGGLPRLRCHHAGHRTPSMTQLRACIEAQSPSPSAPGTGCYCATSRATSTRCLRAPASPRCPGVATSDDRRPSVVARLIASSASAGAAHGDGVIKKSPVLDLLGTGFHGRTNIPANPVGVAMTFRRLVSFAAKWR
jgi:hypothetical protein